MAEFPAIYYGLKLLDEKGFSKIVVETDLLEASSTMQAGCISNHPCWATSKVVWKLVKQIGRV
jgi:hypothetical protein